MYLSLWVNFIFNPSVFWGVDKLLIRTSLWRTSKYSHQTAISMEIKTMIQNSVGCPLPASFFETAMVAFLSTWHDRTIIPNWRARWGPSVVRWFVSPWTTAISPENKPYGSQVVSESDWSSEFMWEAVCAQYHSDICWKITLFQGCLFWWILLLTIPLPLHTIFHFSSCSACAAQIGVGWQIETNLLYTDALHHLHVEKIKDIGHGVVACASHNLF